MRFDGFVFGRTFAWTGPTLSQMGAKGWATAYVHVFFLATKSVTRSSFFPQWPNKLWFYLDCVMIFSENLCALFVRKLAS